MPTFSHLEKHLSQGRFIHQSISKVVERNNLVCDEVEGLCFEELLDAKADLIVLPVRNTFPPLFFLYLPSSCLKASSNSFSEGQLGLKTSARLAMQELMSGSVEKMV